MDVIYYIAVLVVGLDFYATFWQTPHDLDHSARFLSTSGHLQSALPFRRKDHRKSRTQYGAASHHLSYL